MTIECAYDLCQKRFEPRAPHQRFCSSVHKDRQRRRELRKARVATVGRSDEGFAVDAGLTVAELTKELERTRKELALERSKTAAILQHVNEYLVDDPRPLRSEPRALPRGGKRPEADAHLQITDTQVGKLVNDKGIDTLLEFVNSVTGQAAQLIDMYGNVRRIVVHFTGDLIENCGMFGKQVYEVDHVNNGHLVIKQVMVTADMIESIVTALARLGLPVHVTSAPGNHGRRAPNKTADVSAEYDNFDTMAALMARRYMQHVESVTWNIPEDNWFTVTDSFGWRIVTAHGHQFRGQSSGVFERWVLNHDASGTWGGPADVILLGHRHHPFTLNVASRIQVIQSGALDGGSPWYHAQTGKGLVEPSQELFFVTEAGGVYQRHTIYPTARAPRQKAVK